ncbi:MAG: hypothetical protein OER88_12240, partial [Planctomycetota bacterium]|nr:hypothetical protein [Planctomycetota bacterium]
MRDLLRVVLVVAVLAAIAAAQGRRRRGCGAWQRHLQLLAQDDAYGARFNALGAFTEQFKTVRRRTAPGPRTGVVVIPVVVHVVYADAAHNISDAQIQSQIDILNQDFRKLNADVGEVPSVFAG